MAVSRRGFLRQAGSAAAALAVSRVSPGEAPKGAAGSRPPGKPNILVVLADDMACRDCGAYGNKDVKTPHIDRLAAEGMRMDRAFTSTAMCAPTRQQLYTGLFPVRNGAYPNHSHVKPGTKSVVHHLRALGYRVGLVGKTHFGPRESFPFDRGGANFIAKGNPQPWCLFVCSKQPHLPWNQGRPYPPDKLTVPPDLVDNAETRRCLGKYYGEITYLDGEVGRWMKAVRDSGQEDNTIFVFTSEQGPQFPGGKWTCYDLGLKVGLIVRWPGRIKPGSAGSAMVQYVDVVPTLIEAAGGEPSKVDPGCPDANGRRGFDGRSFLNVLLGKADSHGDCVYGVHTTQGIIAGKPYPVRSIRDGRHKYIMNLLPDATFQNTVTENDTQGYWKTWLRDAATDPKAALLTKRYRNRPAEEFYDLEADPHELRNLTGQPGHRARMDQMKKRLLAFMARQGDQGVETELAARKTRQTGRKAAGQRGRTRARSNRGAQGTDSS